MLGFNVTIGPRDHFYGWLNSEGGIALNVILIRWKTTMELEYRRWGNGWLVQNIMIGSAGWVVWRLGDTG